ncbi:MAG: adenylate/guanylate cyclase domain-containing protein [Desulfobacteraceae bacterium]
MIEQWNESAALKLERAAHYIDMRISRPVDLLEVVFKTQSFESANVFRTRIVNYLEELEGVMNAEFVYDTDPRGPYNTMHMRHGEPNRMRLNRGRILKVTSPNYDTEINRETVKILLSLADENDKTAGRIEIVMSFDFLLKDIIELGWWQSDMACLVDEDGKYLSHLNREMESRRILGATGDSLEIAVMDAMASKRFGTVNQGGHPPDMVAGFYSLDYAPWTIILFAKGDKILRPIVRYRNGFIIGSILLVIAVLFLIRLQVGSIVSKVRRLSSSAEKVPQGLYEELDQNGGGDEISLLIENYNSMIKGLRERDLIRDSFGRYIDPEFARTLLKSPDAGALGGVKKEVIILMADIRGFTPMIENLSPEDTIRMINLYFTGMIEVIQRHKGIIVDFVGDGILAFFQPVNGSIEKEADNAVACSLEMHQSMNSFNIEMRKNNLPEMEAGIGINAGEVIVGNIGSETRKKYGIVGAAVNAVHRIQSVAKGGEVVISQSVLDHSKNGIHILKSFHKELKGFDEPVKLHLIGSGTEERKHE